MTTRLHIGHEAVLRNGALEAVLAPAAGGRITALRTLDAAGRSGIDWLVPLDAAVRSQGFASTAWPKAGCYPLVPFSNRIREGRFAWKGRAVQLPLHPGESHALHGGTQQMPWALMQQHGASATMACRHAGNAQAWPWAFTATQTVTLDSAGSMTVALDVFNESDEPMPCGMGLHPYIPAHFGDRIRFDARTSWPPDSEFLATAPQPLVAADSYVAQRAMHADPFTAFYGGFAGIVELQSARGTAIHVECDAAFGHLVLHRPPLEAGSYICIEPVSHVSDAVNLLGKGIAGTGWRAIASGQRWTARMRLKLAHGAPPHHQFNRA
jgi:aldose 1-epimerase